MPRNRNGGDDNTLTKRQASVVNRGNRNISGNVNALLDNLHTMTYGIQKTDKIDGLMDEFNSLLKTEIDSISKTANGDTTSFITKLFSENNKRAMASIKDLENVFNTDEGQLEAFLNEKYRNRLIKQSDLHEVASQLVELQQAITITRDAIISSDVVDGHMSRTLTIDDDSIEGSSEDYISIIEEVEKKFKLQKKIKNFIIPKSLEYGEYNIYHIPYSKIFEDFSKEKQSFNGKFIAYSEAKEQTLLEFVNSDKDNNLIDTITEFVMESGPINELGSPIDKNKAKKNIPKEAEALLENISICNDPVPICILEEGVSSYREYYNEFVESSMFTEADNTISFDNVMKGIDTGIHSASRMNNKKKNKGETFGDIKDCYIRLIDPMHLLPIEIMDEVIGYYYIQEEDISPLSGILTSTVYYSKFDDNKTENNVLSSIAETIVAAFDKKFLQKNMKFKKLIVEALNYFKLNNRKIKFQFIPKEYITQITVNEDEKGHGTSIIEPSLFYAKLYLMLLLFKLMSIILYSNDTRVNYIKQSGIEKNVVNKIQEIARKKQQRQINLTDMFSYTTLINKIGQGTEMYVPVGKSEKRGIETEILSGQDVQINNDLMEMLKKAYISGTGVPDVLMNYFNEADFAKTIEMANNRFQGRVVSFQLDYNEQLTDFYKILLRYTTTIPEEVIDTFSFAFMPPKFHNSSITNDLLNNHVSVQDFVLNILFGQDGLDDPENAPKIKAFKKLFAKERLPMLKFEEIERIFEEATLKGTEESLDPDKEQSEE